MQKFDVVTIGSALKDIMFYSDQIDILKNQKNLTKQNLLAVEYGAKVEIDKVYINYGGGAINVAVGLNNFGLKVAPMINIGKDWVGQEIFYFLKNKKINTSLVRIDKNNFTGFSVILTAAKDREHTIFTYKGATRNLQVDNLKNLKTSWFYISPWSMPNWDQEFQKIIDYKIKNKSKIAWNPGESQLKTFAKIKKFLPKIDLLILNKDEAIELALNIYKRKIDKKKINQSRYLLDLVKDLGVKNLLITAGKKGAYGIDELNKYYYKKTEDTKKIMDTVGAGDAFASGFLAAFFAYHDFSRALNWGIKNSSAVVTQVGAQNGLLITKLK